MAPVFWFRQAWSGHLLYRRPCLRVRRCHPQDWVIAHRRGALLLPHLRHGLGKSHSEGLQDTPEFSAVVRAIKHAGEDLDDFPEVYGHWGCTALAFLGALRRDQYRGYSRDWGLTGIRSSVGAVGEEIVKTFSVGIFIRF